MSQRPGSFVNAAGILASDNPADVVRKLDAAWEADMVEAAARRMFEQLVVFPLNLPPEWSMFFHEYDELLARRYYKDFLNAVKARNNA